MNYGQGHILYFLGIGGIGMSALARYFHLQGAEIHGYDRTRTKLTAQLEQEGIQIHYEEDLSKIPVKVDLVVITPAVPENHNELLYFRAGNFKILKRAEVLGELTSGMFTIAVAGTHGKTTITSMVAHILHSSGIKITAFIGGVANNFDSNLVVQADSKYIIVEADEYDKSFLQLKPNIAIISSMDADHLDIYHSHNNLEQTFYAFAQNIAENGTIIIKHGLKIPKKVKIITYAIDAEATLYADEVMVKDGKFLFRLNDGKGTSEMVKMIIPGRHNIENALAAASAALEIGLDLGSIATALSTYSGVWRRFDIRLNTPEIVYIDDYAHHPEEIRSCVQAARELFPYKTITGIFQPHLFTRTRDFMVEFGKSLALLDQVILLDIYPARELPIEGITAAKLLEYIPLEKRFIVSKHELFPLLDKLKPHILLTMGAGDIDQLVEPIQNHLQKC